MPNRRTTPVDRQAASPLSPPESLYQDVLRALQGWRKGYDDGSPPLADLHLFQQARRQLDAHADPRTLIVHILEEGLRRLAADNAQAADLLRKRFRENLSRQKLAKDRHCSVSHLDRLQHKAVEYLAAVIDSAEQETQASTLATRVLRRANLRMRLDLAVGHDRLFGVDEPRDALLARLLHPGPPHLLLVEGLGGIGKTALTAAVLRHLLESNAFDDVAWVTAQQQRLLFSGEIRPVYAAAATVSDVVASLADQLLPFEERPLPFTVETILPRLQARLRSQRSLLVVDNLETIAEIESLLSVLGSLADPTKLLFTSRVYPRTDAPIHHLVLPELARIHADQMVHYLADLSGIEALAAADEATLAGIYAAIGGNPLALRLFVGQCHRHSPAAVLWALRQAQGRTEEQLFTFIYWHAWNALDESVRDLLFALDLIPPAGADPTYIIESSGLDERAVHDGLAQLVDLNLVEHRLNQASQSRYAIHSLTRTFLHRQVLRMRNAECGMLPEPVALAPATYGTRNGE